MEIVRLVGHSWKNTHSYSYARGKCAHPRSRDCVKVLTFNCLLCFAPKGKLAVKRALQTPASRVRGAAPSPRGAGLLGFRERPGKGRRPPQGALGSRGARLCGVRTPGSMASRLAPLPTKSSRCLSRAARERRTGDQPAPARTRGGGLAAACFLPSYLLCLVKTRCFLNCVFGPGFLSKSLGFTILFPPSGRSTPPPNLRSVYKGRGAGELAFNNNDNDIK